MPRTKDHKILIAYHAYCIDGFTSAWVTWKGLRETKGYKSSQIELLPVSYAPQDIRQLKIEASRDEVKSVYIVDFSVEVEVLRVLTEHCSQVVVLDHHKTAWEMYDPVGGYAGCEFVILGVAGADVHLSSVVCGATMCWVYFFPDLPWPPPTLIRYVNDYDLWKFSLPATKAVNKYLRTQDKTLGNWEYLHMSFENAVTRKAMIDASKSIQLYHDSIVRGLVEQAVVTYLPTGERGSGVNCSPQFSSDVGHELALLSGTFGCTWQVEKSGDVKFSLRSTGYYDVSAIAKANGGGGHENAAGFYLSKAEFIHWLGGKT